MIIGAFGYWFDNTLKTKMEKQAERWYNAIRNTYYGKRGHIMTGEEALKRLSKQYKRQNEFIKESRDRITVVFPKGTKDRIKAHGESVNGLINRLVLGWLDGKDAEVPVDDLPDYDFFADEDH